MDIFVTLENKLIQPMAVNLTIIYSQFSISTHLSGKQNPENETNKHNEKLIEANVGI